MKSLKTAALGKLHWVSSAGAAPAFEIKEGADNLGRLAWRSSCGTLAEAECADGCWTFKRVGFFDPTVTVRARGSETNLALFKPRLSGAGLLELPGSLLFQWKSADIWGTRWAFLGTGGERVMEFSPERTGSLKDLFKEGGRVEFPSSSTSAAEFPLLVCLGWYLYCSFKQESDTGAAVASLAAII